MVAEGIFDARRIVDTLLEQAMGVESGRPRDDISVMAATVLEKSGDETRRLNGRFPL
jgi:hypothetical protein